tara:strand:+ start:525 stop:1061 length:537 start_codon:yes stop_codon:yes gene_type:complete
MLQALEIKMGKSQTEEDFLKFWKHISLETEDETVIVLKGHLLLEDLMREFCASKMVHEDALNDANLSFKQALQLAKALHLRHPEKWVWAGIEKVNNLRNKLAHNLEPKDYEKKRQELIQLVKGEVFDDSIYQSFNEIHQQLAVTIFILYSTLSANLRFRPKGLLTAALEASELGKDSN